MSRPVLCLSNAAFPACSAAEIREAILKAFAFGERGPPSSIGKGSSRGKPSLLLLRFPTAQKAGEGCAQWTGTCAKMGFSHSATGARRVRESEADLFLKYSHGYCEDAKSSPVLWIITRTPKHVLVSKHSSSAVKRERELPLFLLRSVAGWCHLSLALRRSYYCCENVKSEQDPRLPCTTRKKVSALCAGCFISVRPCQSFEFNSNVIAMSGFKVRHFSSKLRGYMCVCVFSLYELR